MSLFGNPVFLEAVDIRAIPSGTPLPPDPETAVINVLGSEAGISGVENVFDPALHSGMAFIHARTISKPQTAAMIDATTDVALFRSGRADIYDMMGIGEINAVNTDYGISTIERAETFIQIGADTSFNRVEDAQVSGFVCPGMESTGVGGAGGGGGGKVKYDIRYKRNLINF
tara:strand:+ start:3386 stop:3901 length:516 start_codon:yes stop_codon:yes gene_type:complete